MTTLLEIREMILAVYSRYELYIDKALKFLAVLLGLIIINGRVGYMESLSGTLPTLLIALIGTLFPGGGVLIIWALLIVVHLYALSLEAALTGGILFLLLALVYFRFAPGDSLLLEVYPVCSVLGIPYVLPIAGGLLASPVSGVTVAVGVIVDRFLLFVSENEAVIQSSELDVEEMISRFQFLIDGLIGDEVLWIRAAAMIISGVLVYLVRRLSIPYAWVIASGVGAVAQMVTMLIGAVVMDAQIGVGTAFLGVLVSFGIAAVISFMAFNLDYTRTESTQFEDDDYYYYVKAIPKSVYTRPKRTVKTISTHRPSRENIRGSRGTAQRYYAEDEEEWDTETMNSGEPYRGGYDNDYDREDDFSGEPERYRDDRYDGDGYGASGEDYY